MSTFIFNNMDELDIVSKYLKRKKVDIYMDTIYIAINSVKECILGYMLSNGMYNKTFSNAYNNVDLKLYSLLDLMHLDGDSKDEDASQELENILSHIQFIIEPSIYDKLDKYLLHYLKQHREFVNIRIYKNGFTIINIV